MRSHEMIYIFSKAGAYYNRIDLSGNYPQSSGSRGNTSLQYGIERKIKTNNEGKRCIVSVIQNQTSQNKGGHPTEKPEALYRFLIERYCPANGTLVDPTAGSFNSCFAAVALERKAIGIEKDDKFFNKASKRLLEK